ncbi:hypothetical protein HYX08_06590 [Candidatus Woesearchaeota archaeon]|nr:hypothetical protein [Candidatus Woesearchaeota archaeon]
MDTLAHGLWSYAIFHKKRYVWLAALFGVLPDILSFGILFMLNLVNGSFHNGWPTLDSLPGWLFSAYNFTHSLVMFIAVFALVYLISKKWLWPLAAWAIHILIDIPTHSFGFFPTPFLWPLSDYKFDGISWGTPWFMLANYSALTAVFIIIAHSKAKERALSRKSINPKK